LNRSSEAKRTAAGVPFSRRYLRRLELLLSLFPPPEGYAVLPEQLKTR
jgi:hypothetical protein